MNVRNWVVFNAGEDDENSISTHESYSDAVFEAQCRGCTEARPKRIHAGYYTLHGCSGRQYIIATPEGLKRAGYERLLELLPAEGLEAA